MERQINKKTVLQKPTEKTDAKQPVSNQVEPSMKENASANAEFWSEEQIKQLEVSMKAVPQNLGTRVRWERIAMGVDGKDQK